MRTTALLATLAIGVALIAAPTASAWTGNVFHSPSGNIVCKYRGSLDSISCGRWNDQRIVSMTSSGRAREGNYLSWGDETSHLLSYGMTFRGYGSHITCFSGFNGMRCTNWNGHGFFLSRSILNEW